MKRNYLKEAILILPKMDGEVTRSMIFLIAKNTPAAIVHAYECLHPPEAELVSSDAAIPPWIEDAKKLYPEGEQKLQAIKHVRAMSGMGLKEAKDFVEGGYKWPR